ncbi:MAG: hypothetical protein P1P82_04450 [Bacteroidales bacterium]|nr:hypothetical protein [Bacteroidales bacterium]
MLHEIYQKHRRYHRENGDSKQMCCMWSTENPPDIIADTEPFADIEATFNIIIDDEEASNLYDLDLEDAALRIMEIQKKE